MLKMREKNIDLYDVKEEELGFKPDEEQEACCI